MTRWALVPLRPWIYSAAVGGLTHGLLAAGIDVEAGIDNDERMEYAYRANNPGVTFLRWDLTQVSSEDIARLFAPGKYRLLAGCAPCQPFSKATRPQHRQRLHDMLDYFGAFIRDIRCDLVLAENVAGLATIGRDVFTRFLEVLHRGGYYVDWRVVNAAEYGVPQLRKRLILLASRLGEIAIPQGPYRRPDEWRTVRQTIGHLPLLEAGAEDPHDPLHVAPRPSALGMLRIAATPRNGGTWRDWADNPAMQCHWRDSKEGWFSVYSRMRWDCPSYTITSHCTEASSGPYVHPEQHRPITLREAALLQSFPATYRFWPPDEKVNRKAVARMIGNAVPPLLAAALGKAIMQHVVAPQKNFTLFS